MLSVSLALRSAQIKPKRKKRSYSSMIAKRKISANSKMLSDALLVFLGLLNTSGIHKKPKKYFLNSFLVLMLKKSFSYSLILLNVSLIEATGT